MWCGLCAVMIGVCSAASTSVQPEPTAALPAGPATMPSEPPASQPPQAQPSRPSAQGQDESTPAPQPPLTPEEQGGHAAMAERFAAWAKMALAQPTITSPFVRHSVALLDAAVRENPKEPRFLRLLIEARLQLGTPDDLVAARKALKQYLDLLAQDRQTDVFAQVQLMDLFVTQMENAGKQMDYLHQVTGADGLPAEVRSHAAMRLARVYLDRGQEKEAAAAIDDAVRLNPLNAAAQQVKYQLIRNDPNASAAQRVGVMMAMLRANPLQPDVMAGAARELAMKGLVDQAMSMYSLSFDVSRSLGLGRSMPDFTDFCAAVCVAGQPRDASSAAQQVLDADPGNGDAAFIKLLSERQLADQQRIDVAMQQASDAVLRRMAEVHEQLNKAPEAQQPPAAGGAGAGDAGAQGAGATGAGTGGVAAGATPDAANAAAAGGGGGNAPAGPTTQPIEAVADYVMADVQKLKDRGDGQLYAAYVGALVRLAWYQVYFAQNPNGVGKLIEALKSLLPDGDVNIARIEGWSFIPQNKDAAGNRLSAVADRDPLSKLGLIRLDLADPATAPNAMAELTKLASENASGITGAMLVGELREHNGKFVPAHDADSVRSEYDKFPKDFFNILTTPEKFYRLTAEPLLVAHSFGEPMLVRVRIQNISDYDLTLDADGAIHRDLWFDVKVTGIFQKNLAGVAYDRMGQQVVLKAKTGVAEQIVRVDQGQLAAMMEGYPAMSIPLLFSVFTNPTRNATGVGPGPAGQRSQFNRPIERAAAPVNQQTVPQFINYLMAGKPAERIQVAELMAQYVRIFATQAQQAQQQQQQGGDTSGAGGANPAAGTTGNAPAAGAGAGGGAGGAANAKVVEQLMQTAGQFREMLLRAADAREGSPVVHGWVEYLAAILSPPPARQRRMEQMLGSDAWEERLLGLRLVAFEQPDEQKKIAAKVAESDREPVMRQFAASLVELVNQAPATQPAAAATQPLALPGAPGAPAPDASGMTLTPTAPTPAPLPTDQTTAQPPGGR